MIRKIVRSILAQCNRYNSPVARWWANSTHAGLHIEKGVLIAPHVKFQVTDGARLCIKSGSTIGQGSQITVQSGRLDIGSNVFIGIGAVIVAKESINIGDDCQIAEYVVIRDQDHKTDSSPIRNAGFYTSPIHIGKDVWIGCKATILRGVTIGEHSVVAAHALVNKDVPGGVLVAGAPARIIKKIEYT